MAEQDVGEEVGQILNEIGGRLPEANFGSDEEDSENEAGLTVFSRSRHLKVVGFDEASDAFDGNADNNEKTSMTGEQEISEEENLPSVLPSPPVQEFVSVAVQTREKSSSDDSGLEDSDWTKFKTEFAEKLQTSEDKFKTASFPPPQTFTSPSAFRQQVIIDAITTLHSTGRSQEGHKGQEVVRPMPSTLKENETSEDGVNLTHDQRAVLSPSDNTSSKSVLALDTLDSISETTLDHVLISLESSERGANDGGTDGRNRGTPPAPKLAWPLQNGAGNEALMEELERLSATQSSKTQSAVFLPEQARDEPSQASRPSHGSPIGSDKPTVFLDLRQSLGEAAADRTSGRGLAALARMKRESTSDSEEDTDPYSWIAERKQLKGKLENQTLSSIAGNHCNTNHHQRQLQHNLHHAHKLNAMNSGAQEAKLGNDEKEVSFVDVHSMAKDGGQRVGAEQHNGGSLKQLPPSSTIQQAGLVSKATQKRTIKPQVQAKGKVVSNTGRAHEKTESAGLTKEKKPCQDGDAASNSVERQRSSDSFTLSSSLSEGEGPTSSEGHGDNQSRNSGTKDSRSSQSSQKGKKSSKKQSKKSKRSNKKDKGQGGQSSSADQQSRSKKISKRRAYVLERIRRDSLTSSDDEHSLGSSDVSSSTDSGRSSLLHQDSILEDGESAIIDVEKLKLHLQRRILAKKPPSQFKTPSTQPLFHEEISFERELTCMKPGSTPSALLVLQICEHGLVAPPEMFSEIDTSAKLGFHLLVLTWLFHAALSTQSRSLTETESNGTDVTENGLQERDGCGLPFEIVSVQYTILDGNPSFLVGVALRGEQEEGLQRVQSSGSDTFFESEAASEINQLEAYFQQTPFSAILTDIISNDTITKLLSPATIDQVKAMLSSPLESVFSFQDDVTPLSTPVSFFWHSSYHPSCLPSSSSLKSHSPLTTTVCSLGAVAGGNIGLVFSILSSIYLKGLDIAGLRLVYDEACSSIEASLALGEESDYSTSRSPMLVMAVRGPDSIYRMMDIVGPKDESLAKVTDPTSLTALYGSEMTSDLHCLRTPYSAAAALAKYFGGRACLKSGSVLGISDAYTRHERKKRQRVRFSESESAAEDLPLSPLLDASFSPLITNRQRLVVEPYNKVVIVISPHIPTSCYSTVLTCCDKLGFDVFGLKRLRLNSKRANALNIPPSFLIHFTPSSTPPSPVASEFFTLPPVFDHTQTAPPLPSCLMIIGRENAILHTLALKAALVSDLVSLLKSNPTVRESSNLGTLVEYIDALLHVTEHSQDLLKYLGHFDIPTTVSSNQPRLGSGWDMQDLYQDELCFVAVPHSDGLIRATDLLDKVFCISSIRGSDRLSEGSMEKYGSAVLKEREEEGGFELLCFKVVPELPRFHAKQLCPLPSDDPQYQQAINLLSDVPAILLLFRGIGSNRRLQQFSTLDTKLSPIHSNALKEKLQVIISDSFQDAYRLANIFLSDKELFNDLPNWVLARYVPLSWHQDSDILHRLQHEQEQLLSLVTVPMSRMKMAMKIMDKLSRSGCAFVGIATMATEEEEFEEVIHIDKHESSSSEGPMVVFCVQRINAVWHVKHTLKSFTDSQSSKCHIHCSGGFNSAMSDIKQYFPDGIFCSPSSLVTDYGLKLEADDIFDHLLLPESSLPPSDSSLGHYLSPLTETNVMVLPPSLVVKKDATLSTAGFVDVLDFLSSTAAFQIVGMKMVRLSVTTAGTLHAISSDSESSMQVQELTSGPSLVVIVRRDNAIACCQMIIKSALQSTRSGDWLSGLMSKVIFPTDAKKAKRVFELFQLK